MSEPIKSPPPAEISRVTVTYAYCCNGPVKYCDCTNPSHGTATMGANEAGNDYAVIDPAHAPAQNMMVPFDVAPGASSVNYVVINGVTFRPEAHAVGVQEQETYTIGENTMARVFKVAGLINVHDLQAVFDAVEEALTPSAKQDIEPVAWLRPGEHVPIQGCPFGAMWISDKDDPRAFPVYAAPPPSHEATGDAHAAKIASIIDHARKYDTSEGDPRRRYTPAQLDIAIRRAIREARRTPLAPDGLAPLPTADAQEEA